MLDELDRAAAAARVSTAWDGRLWRPKGQLPDAKEITTSVSDFNAVHRKSGAEEITRPKARLPDDDDPLRAAKGIGLGLLIMLVVWIGIIVAVHWALS